MNFYPASLTETAAKLRSNELDVIEYIAAICDRLDEIEPQIHAFLPEEGRRERLLREAALLKEKYPDPATRPPLYGAAVGIKDLFNVDGFPTQAGSKLPADLFAGPEAPVVTALRDAGALIIGKTQMDEFAYAEPSPTRNPHNITHTPGGSSSGSAAAVATGLCALGLGTQTSRSITAPASFCGVVGYKPSFGSIPLDGVVLMSPSLDTVGFLTQDVESAELAASLLFPDWTPANETATTKKPVLGVPEGQFFTFMHDATRDHFEQQVARLEAAGYTVKRVAMPWEPVIDDLYPHTISLLCAEMAHVHAEWIARYEDLYRHFTKGGIRHGQTVPPETVEGYRKEQLAIRDMLDQHMLAEGIDLWITPSQATTAPEGYEQTGYGGMTIPWSYAGLPTISLPAGMIDGMPMGLQGVGGYKKDGELLAYSKSIAMIVRD